MGVLVSIICNTYNHENFIAACLEGFLSQKCDFQFEILIHDDASTDNTQEVIRNFVNQNPSVVKPIFQIKNQGSLGINNWTEYQFPRAIGKYIALCDGDDYWTDPHKLQKQVDFLENNIDYDIVFHKAFMGKDIETITAVLPFIDFPENKVFFNILDIIELEGFMPTASVVFRAEKLQKDFLDDRYMSGDIPLYVGILSKGGKMHYIPEIMSFYRRHEGNITIQHHGYSNLFCINKIFMWKQLNLLLDCKYENEICTTIEFYYHKIKANISQWLFSKLEFLLKPISSLLTKVVVNRGLKKYK